MPQSLYFCAYVGRKKLEAFVVHDVHSLMVHLVLCYSVTHEYQISLNTSSHWKKHALPSGRQNITKLDMLQMSSLLLL